jgi:molybdate transport system substrate-binding protein
MKTATSAMQRMVVALLALMLTAMPAMAGQLNLSVAASLKEALDEMTTAYTAEHPGTTFLKNYGASGTLAGQIENGAPADLFISANVKWVDYLKDKKLVDAASVKTFALNDLVFAGSTAKKVRGMSDLARLDKIAIGSPASVPAGEYATQAIRKSGLDGKLSGKLVMAKDVRESLMYAELGEVDGSFVYRTDALLAKKAKILFVVPRELYPQVTYPMALTVTGAGKSEAKAFLAWLQGSKAKSILKKFGFTLK